MALSTEDRMVYYERQACFTKGIRQHVYRMISLAQCRKVIDIGSGAGSIAKEIAERVDGPVVALEKDYSLLQRASSLDKVTCLCGDALRLPFKAGYFDAATCHFLLMWLEDPSGALVEMKRVVRPGGWIVALAEPDYGGWVGYPEDLGIGKMLSSALIKESADPEAGRKLRAIFGKAGLDADVGVSAGMWNIETLRSEFEEEWEWRFRIVGRSPSLEKMKEKEAKAIEKCERLLFMPIFYGFAQKK